jgi:hypothetical protein
MDDAGERLDALQGLGLGAAGRLLPDCDTKNGRNDALDQGDGNEGDDDDEEDAAGGLDDGVEVGVAGQVDVEEGQGRENDSSLRVKSSLIIGSFELRASSCGLRVGAS